MQKQTPTTQHEALQYAQAWQNWQNTQSLSWAEISEWTNEFEYLAKKFGLVDLFKENGII